MEEQCKRTERDLFAQRQQIEALELELDNLLKINEMIQDSIA